MSRMSLPVFAAALTIGAFSVGFGASTAGAVTAISSNATISTTADPNLQLAYVKKKVVVKKKGVTRKIWVYDRGKNGARFRYKHGPYVYYYGGYYYTRPWWTLCIGC